MEFHNSTESGDKSDDHLTLPPLTIKAKMDELSSGGESDAEPTPTDMLEDICDVIQYHLIINRRDARYTIHDCIKQR